MHPRIMTTLEEDFKALGIVRESDEREQTGKPLEEGRTFRRAVVRNGHKKVVKFHKMNSSKRRKEKQRYKKRKNKLARYRAKASTARSAKKHARILGQSADTVSNMLENTQEILASISESKTQNSVNGFAQLAITAELLARSFAMISEQVKNKEERSDLVDASRYFSEAAEEAAALAKALKEDSDSLDMDKVQEAHTSHSAEVLKGLALFEEYTGDEEDEDDDETIEEEDEDEDGDVVAEGDEDDDDEEDEDDDCEDDDDEDDDEEMDEGKDDDDYDGDKSMKKPPGKKQPPWLKKK